METYSYLTPSWAFVLIKSFKVANCLGPSCWMMSGRRSLIVFVSGFPTITNVLLWTDANTILNHLGTIRSLEIQDCIIISEEVNLIDLL